MRKILAVTLISGLLLATFPGAALAGDTHAVSNRWAGVAIGAAAAVVGGALLTALAPAAIPPATYSPPVAYSTPPLVTYTTPPPVVYAPPAVVYPPPVIYRPAPVIVHHEWGRPDHWNRGHWNREHFEHGRGWDRR
jgi:hypothetical protein